ncbi:hypothetical protein B0T14DRAFT_327722 [Immersiella caudata]|uniref:VOC domain-containing protein n=1 Tax=Immersiella caudata TaxID=314043 RepID=A0AA39TXY3_9PEZI|nr:hypothetical protein B0T14DRAFT_327722 [Immersiella caudata]
MQSDFDPGSPIATSCVTSRHPAPHLLCPRCQKKKSTPIAKALSLDHLVLTVKDLDATIRFYQNTIGAKHAVSPSKSTERHALPFGSQKINLHLSGREFEPKAQRP